jgi:hypothetical protein
VLNASPLWATVTGIDTLGRRSGPVLSSLSAAQVASLSLLVG